MFEEIKKLTSEMCPLSKTVIKISAFAPFFILGIALIMLIFSESSLVLLNFPDYMAAAAALPAAAVIMSLLADLVWRDRK